MKSIFYLFTLTFLLLSCDQTTKTEDKAKDEVKSEVKADKTLVTNIFSDPKIQSIYELADRKNATELLVFFKSENPVYRRHAVLNFANIPDSSYAKNLIPMLRDKDSAVRLNASWALSQNSIAVLDSVFINSLEKEKKNIVRNGLWEALGKKIGPDGLNYFVNKTPAVEEEFGYAAGLFTGRKLTKTNEICIDKALDIIFRSKSVETKIYASQFLSRVPKEQMEPKVEAVLNLLRSNLSAEVDKNLIYSIMNITNPKIASFINNALINKGRVNENKPVRTVALLYAFDKQFDRPSYQVLKQYLVSKNENIALAATKGLGHTNFEPAGQKTLMADPIMKGMLPSVRAEFLKHCITASGDLNYINEVKQKALNHSNSVIKGHYIKALVADKSSADYLIYLFEIETTLPAKSDCVAALLEMEENGYPEGFEFEQIVDVVFQSGDAGSIALLCDHVRNSGENYDEAFPDLEVLEEAKKSFTAQEDLEVYVELEKTIAFLKGKEYEEKKPRYNHPINWDHVKGIHPQQVIKVNTSEGVFKIQLDVESAPGSVSTIVKLVEKEFYNNKTFHRVVPNFVIQTGCPRGDGFGSVNFSIRSEFNKHRYYRGAVGLASLGPDTESCQWFVMHTAVSSLEGRYTIFGNVIEGLDVIQKIRKGSTIEKIVLMPNY